ncbi:MAG: M48 family metallopeptidase [Gammaproteobacteria bacterium]|nr:M48 family metallopeptidase [Gammaproteobacteria bacterium]
MKPLLILLLLGPLATTPVLANNDLPDIGLSASARISSSQEYQIGRAIVRNLHQQGAIVTDPEITAYIQSIGSRIAVHAHDGNQRFTFFVVDDPQINAFALPGGFIGVHTGLINATSNENELAGVLAHEIAHVSQKHIARMIESSGQTSILTTAAIVAAVLIGGLTGAGGDAMGAAVSVAQGAAMQQQINFTRENEYEADRIGITYLADAGFDPQGMPTFFKTLARKTGTSGIQIPEFFRTHPMTSNRIAETSDRANQLAQLDVPSSTSYKLAKARLSVLAHDNPTTALQNIEDRIEGHPTEERDELQYAYALALIRSGRAGQAVELLEPLLQRNQGIIAFHTIYAEALHASGDVEDALKSYDKSQQLFPRNVPITMSHSAALIENDRPEKARKLMLDLVNNVNYTTEQLRLLAMAASSAGYSGDAHYYMSEFHVLNGELILAADQLEMALKAPDIRDYQYARIESRLQQIQEVIRNSRKQQRKPRREPGPRELAIAVN